MEIQWKLGRFLEIQYVTERKFTRTGHHNFPSSHPYTRGQDTQLHCITKIIASKNCMIAYLQPQVTKIDEEDQRGSVDIQVPLHVHCISYNEVAFIK